MSLYRYAPVFRVRDGRGDWVVKRTGNAHSGATAIAGWLNGMRSSGVDVVVPVAELAPNPRRVGDDDWVAYPFVAGTAYTGQRDEIAAAGELLGQIHAAIPTGTVALGAFDPLVSRPARWTDGHAEAAVRAMRSAGRDAAPFLQTLAMRREMRPMFRSAMLPAAGCSFDFKASNLVFTPRPVLIDPDHAAYIPRLYDLAVAALLFHNDAPHAPHRLWTGEEWHVFLSSYRSRITLTGEEVSAWRDVLRAAWLDQAVWLLGNFPEGWAEAPEAAYLDDLATFDLEAFAI